MLSSLLAIGGYTFDEKLDYGGGLDDSTGLYIFLGGIGFISLLFTALFLAGTFWVFSSYRTVKRIEKRLNDDESAPR